MVRLGPRFPFCQVQFLPGTTSPLLGPIAGPAAGTTHGWAGLGLDTHPPTHATSMQQLQRRQAVSDGK